MCTIKNIPIIIFFCGTVFHFFIISYLFASIGTDRHQSLIHAHPTDADATDSITQNILFIDRHSNINTNQ